MYECMQGETWDAIAWRELGDVRHTPALMDANRDKLGVQIFSGGEELTMPTVESGRVISKAPWEE